MSQISLIFRIIKNIESRKVILLFTLVIFSNLIESIGLATLLPVLVVASGGDLGNSELAQFVMSVIGKLGINTDLTTLCIIIGTTLISREIIMFFAMTYVGRIIADMSLSFRTSMLENFLRVDWSYFSESKIGGMTVAMTTFTDNASKAVNLSVRSLALIIRTAFYLVIIISISGLFAFIAGFAALGSVLALSSLVKLSKKYGDKQGRLVQSLGSQFTDVFASIKTIKVMGREENLSTNFKKKIFRLNKTLKNLVWLQEGLAGLQRVIELIVILTTLYVAVKIWGISILEMVVIGGLMSQIIMNVSKSQKLLQKVAQFDIYFWRTLEIIRDTKNSRESLSGKKTPSLENKIDFQEVSFNFPEKNILNLESFSIPVRKVTIIYGPSGQGKTTITDLLTRLFQPNSGKIKVDDTDLNEINIHKWRKKIGYVPQEMLLINSTIKENVTFGLNNVSDKKVLLALEQAGALDFVRELSDGLNHMVGERGMKLSGGQRQRLSIARALIHDPEILILDEITSALDKVTEKRICKMIQKLSDQKTIIAITHRPAWLDVADQTLYLNNGKVRTK